MTSTPSFTPEQQERFAVLCAWCANGCTAAKSKAGEYVHFRGTERERPCQSSHLRRQLEKTPHERAQESWASNICPACGAMKRERKDFFCRKCFYSLDKEIPAAFEGLMGRLDYEVVAGDGDLEAGETKSGDYGNQWVNLKTIC